MRLHVRKRLGPALVIRCGLTVGLLLCMVLFSGYHSRQAEQQKGKLYKVISSGALVDISSENTM